MAQITIDSALCKKCMTCVEVCPMAVFELNDKSFPTKVIRENLCISCGHCVINCNQKAISHSAFPEDWIIKIEQEKFPSYDQVLELLRSRRSIRNYKDKPVEKELIEKVINGSYLAQSAENFQSVQYTVIQDKGILKQIVEITIDYFDKDTQLKKSNVDLNNHKTLHSIESVETLINAYKSKRDMFLFNSPCLIVFHSRPDISFAEANINLALQNATLIAHSLNLGGFFTGYVVSCAQKDTRISKLINVPEGNKIYGAITLGYPKYKYKNWVIRKSPVISWS